MRRSFAAVLSVMVLLLAIPSSVNAKKNVKYVFYMIGDGMGINQIYATNLYNNVSGLPALNFTSFPVSGFICTSAANTLVTDSAAAGTALATGTKTNWFYVGVDPDGKPLVSVAERAKACGCGVGVVTSVGVNHATPAAFYGHTSDREVHTQITEQLLASGFDFAAGSTILTDDRPVEAWVDEAVRSGITVYSDPEGYKPTSDRVIYLSADTSRSKIPYAIDRTEADSRLDRFTAAAVEHLWTNYAKKGFFLMVEGGAIDYACHSNDIATVVHETNDFARSVGIALDFYNQHPDETLIVVLADHETGGLVIAGEGPEETVYPEILKNQKVSMRTLTSRFDRFLEIKGKDTSWEEAKAFLSDEVGLWTAVDVTAEEENAIHQAFDDMIAGKADEIRDWYSVNSKIATLVIDVITRRARFSWTSNYHSGSPLGFYAIGKGAEMFESARDNTDMPRILGKVAGYTK